MNPSQNPDHRNSRNLVKQSKLRRARRDGSLRLRGAAGACIEPMESRVFLSVAAATGTRLNPLINKLDLLSDLDRRTANIAAQGGAKLYAGLTGVGGKAGMKADVIATAYSPFSLDITGIKKLLKTAPMEFTAAAANPLLIVLPMPDGSFDRFYVVEAPVVAPALAAKYPDTRTYRGIGIDDPTASVRLDYSSLGFHAQILSPNGAVYIDPYWHLNQSTYISYFHRDAIALNSFIDYDADTFTKGATTTATKTTKTTTTTANNTAVTNNLISFTTPTVNGTQLKEYMLALAADGEYTQFFGGTLTAGHNAVVAAANRVTGIYESELGIRLTLVANNDLLIYTNPGTDPYTNTGNDINTNTTNCSNVIGVNNYDIGHVFTTGSGGVAGLGVVGNNSQKGRGTTGSPSPTGDSFWVDYVAHEMGHQFGANHTFNSGTSNCGGGNRSGVAAYEPGSGSSIMAYAGICGADDLAAHSDPYYNWKSLDEIVAYTSSGVGLSSATVTTTGNHAPTANAGNDYTIPANTPFALTGSGSDSDGDTITYDWQEHDLGSAATTLVAGDVSNTPLFRMYNPTTNPTRTLPQLNSVLSGLSVTTGYQNHVQERLYTSARTSVWRLVVRDNRLNGGGFATDDMNLTVAASSAFALTSQNTATTWQGGTLQAVTWSVGSTTSAPINTSNVNILLSTDGGQTFPITLASNVANDGSETVTVPINTVSASGRIKIVPTNSIYFDINNAAINITMQATQSSATGTPALSASSDTGLSNTDGTTKLNSGLSFDVPNTQVNSTVDLYVDSNPNSVGTATGNGGTITVVYTGAALSDGVHTFVTKQTAAPLPQSVASPADQVTIDTAAPAFAAPLVSLTPNKTLTFVFNEDVGASISQQGNNSINLQNNTQSLSLPADSYTYTAGTKTAVYTYSGIIPDGYYSVLSNASDLAGNAATGPSYNFIYANSFGNSFYIQRSAGGGTNVEMYEDRLPGGSPDIAAPFANVAQIFVQGTEFDDTITLDYANGSPIPAGNAFRFLGDTGHNTFNMLNGGTYVFASDPWIDSQNLAINVSAGSTVQLNAALSRVAGISLDNGNLTLPTNGNALLSATGLSISNNGNLDLADNDLLIDYAASDSSPLSILEGYIASARNGSLWNGTGLNSSAAGVLPRVTGLGAIEATSYKSVGGRTLFDGQTLDDSAIVIKYTYYGDADLSGKVDGADYSHVDATFNQEHSAGNIGGWFNGDFNYNGKVDGQDYGLIDSAFNTQIYGVL